MRKIVIVMVVVLLSVCWCGKLEATIFYDDGVVHNIDSYINDSVKVRNSTTGDLTTLNLFSGGHISGHLAGEDDSQINVFDGYIENNLVGWENSTIKIYGGHVDATIWAYDNSEVYLSGGSVKSALFLRDNSVATLLGGSLGTGIVLENSSQISIWGSGFEVDGISAGYGIITNTGEYVDGYGRAYSYGTLTGKLYSGETINNVFYIYNDSTIELVPEPTTLLLLSLGTVLLRKQFNKRDKKIIYW